MYCFVAGNLARVTMVGVDEYDLYIRSDTCNANHRLWFYFTVSNARLSQVSPQAFKQQLPNDCSPFVSYKLYPF